MAEMPSRDDPIVSTSWLAARLGDPVLRVVDASWHMPNAGRDARAEYRQGHIPGAVFFDIDAVADTSSPLPHMLATPEAFAEKVGALGIAESDTIIVYDSAGLFSAARAWWNFSVMGAASVFVLDGGLPGWLADGRPVESGEPEPTLRRFEPRFDAARVADAETVLARRGLPGTTIVDLRPAARFAGTAPEPRPGLRSGHIPGSVSLPFPSLVRDGSLLPEPELRVIVAATIGEDDSEIIASCGSGVTAPILMLALARLGAAHGQIHDGKVYDGSWSEWGARDDLPVETA